jgi:hypothetical protein
MELLRRRCLYDRSQPMEGRIRVKASHIPRVRDALMLLRGHLCAGSVWSKYGNDSFLAPDAVSLSKATMLWPARPTKGPAIRRGGYTFDNAATFEQLDRIAKGENYLVRALAVTVAWRWPKASYRRQSSVFQSEGAGFLVGGVFGLGTGCASRTEMTDDVVSALASPLPSPTTTKGAQYAGCVSTG